VYRVGKMQCFVTLQQRGTCSCDDSEILTLNLLAPTTVGAPINP